MNLNPDLIRARCAEIEESVSRLERFKPASREEFLSNPDTLDQVYDVIHRNLDDLREFAAAVVRLL